MVDVSLAYFALQTTTDGSWRRKVERERGRGREGGMEERDREGREGGEGGEGGKGRVAAR